MKYQKGAVHIFILIGVFLFLAGAGTYFVVTKQNNELPLPTPTPTPVPLPLPSPVPAPIPAPVPAPKGDYIYLRSGEREGSFLLEKIYSDRVEGLNFMEYPVARDEGYPVTLRIGEMASNGCTVTLTFVKTEGNTAVFLKNTDLNRPCPICLAEDTLIQTPSGFVPVQKLQKGMAVWTQNEEGARVSAVVTKTSKTPVPLTHEIIHITLSDGRNIFISPGHPAADGRMIGELSTGDTLDGSRIISFQKIPYKKEYTYDILPEGETGLYWANGILLGSTLR